MLKYRVVDIYEIESYEQEGYELVELITEGFIEYCTVSEQIPTLSWVTDSTNYYPTQQPQYIQKTIPVAKNVTKALMKLTKAGEVLFGDPNTNQK